MCMCTLNIKTPFCGKGICVEPVMSNKANMIRLLNNAASVLEEAAKELRMEADKVFMGGHSELLSAGMEAIRVMNRLPEKTRIVYIPMYCQPDEAKNV